MTSPSDPKPKGRLLRAPPSPMMDAGVREGVLRSLNVAVPPMRPAPRGSARTDVRLGADYFSATTFPLTYPTVRPYNALKFHIFFEN